MALGSASRKDTPYNDRVALGLIPGVKAIHKYGRNPDIDSGFEALWNGGGAYTGFDAVVGETVEIFSGSIQDAVSGTGAHEVILHDGLDINGIEIEPETVALHATDGTISVFSTGEYWRLPRVKCGAVGSNDVNVGEITVRQSTTTAVIFAKVPAGYGTTMIAAFTIPAAKRGLFDSWFAAFAGKVKSISSVRLVMREQGKSKQVLEEQSLMADGSSTFPREYKVPKDSIIALTDIFVEADTDTINVAISGGFDLKLYDV